MQFTLLLGPLWVGVGVVVTVMVPSMSDYLKMIVCNIYTYPL